MGVRGSASDSEKVKTGCEKEIPGLEAMMREKVQWPAQGDI